MHARTAAKHVLTAGSIGTAGDVLMQELEKPGSVTAGRLDTNRTLRMLAYRIPQAPILDLIWKRFDAWALALRLHGARAVVFKVACDQTLCSPLFISMFFTTQSLLEGQNFWRACERTKQAAWPTWQRGVQFYGCIHIFTFAFVPVTWRIAWNSGAALFWTAYLSHANKTLQDGEVRGIAQDREPDQARRDAAR